MISKKIVLIGDFSTGKTSLIRRFVDNAFSDDYLSTIGVKVSVKAIETPIGKVRALIWDIEGGTSNQPMNETYLNGAHGGIVVADITRAESLENIALYVDTARRRIASIRLHIALNKVDLLSPEEAEPIAEIVRKRFGDIPVTLTSAKTGEGVETLFTSLASQLLRKHDAS